MDLGLSGEEFSVLARRARRDHSPLRVDHGSGRHGRRSHRQSSAPQLRFLEFAEAAPRLQRLVCWSSATVSGNREGFVKETELDDQDGFSQSNRSSPSIG